MFKKWKYYNRNWYKIIIYNINYKNNMISFLNSFFFYLKNILKINNKYLLEL